ncbi:acetoin utilization protein AcuC [Meiothermus granaticius]|uniref:Acetoin utilization protein AcuC n=1 Tax=Meiothermus granaticius NBRC 107808 TaxID=1227551 RepID=A0A399FB94_9DEIN|nr:acetoin utilization protein AcuC [Meiothermus granaticius]RIH92956.1 Acetoin utilization protein AcuC [Meiothermus granaticius NBRC 107808]GEM86206.1 acetoin utilization protein AcuC [Meiothermus granaticius NBRC 107808]
MSVPVFYSPHYLEYNFGPQHPFNPMRLEMLLDLLGTLGQAPLSVEPPQATREEVRGVHLEALVRRVEAASHGVPLPDLAAYGLGTGDTPIFPGMDEATRWLVGGTLEAARWIARGEAREVLQLGGGLHHAQADLASGFCVYNDLSIAIRHLSSQGLRVAYVDIDVHHGDGVQWIHYEEENVLTFSLHESGRYLFPGTGQIHEIGKAAGTGRKLNLPLEPFTEDGSYLEVFQMALEPALRWFRPDVMVIQGGADAHYLDPLAELLLTTRGYAQLFRLLRQYSAEFSGGRALYTLGGGYNLDSSSRVWALLYLSLQNQPLPDHLPEDWLRRWGTRLGHFLTHTLHDPEGGYAEIPRRLEIEARNRQVAARMLETVRPYWR